MADPSLQLRLALSQAIRAGLSLTPGRLGPIGADPARCSYEGNPELFDPAIRGDLRWK